MDGGMTDLAKSAIIGFMENWQRTFILVLILILSFPPLMVGYFIAKEVGWVEDEGTVMRRAIYEFAVSNNANVQTLRIMMSENLYYQQRTCINTATNKEEKNECIKPRWERRMDDKPVP